MTEQYTHYTPQKTAFLSRRLAVRGVAWGLFVVIALIAVSVYEIPYGQFIVLAVALLLAAYITVNSYVTYSKQSYAWSKHEVLFKAGTLTSDFETELKYNNITHVRLIKPFIEYRLFGTGHILIEAAGSADTEVLMQSVYDPEAIYVEIQDILSASTFSLSYDKLLLKERPVALAVGLEVARNALAAVAAVIFGLSTLGGGGIVAAAVEWLPLLWLIVLSGIVGSLTVVGASIYLYALYQDLIRRTYFIYEDVLCYTRGFLTRQEAFIPVENLADSELTQTLLDKLLNLYDVVVSCQGSGSEIQFRNLARGKEVEREIDGLINRQSTLADAAKPAEESGEDSPAVPAEMDSASTGSRTSYYMEPKRALLWYVWLIPLFIVFPPLLFLPIYTYLVTKNTQYYPTSRGVASHFSLFSTQNVEFSRDKITAVVIKRNLIDRWMDTVTVSFWSIGSTSAINFRHIKYYEGLDADMRSFGGIESGPELDQIHPQFNISNMVRGNLYSMGGIATLVVAATVAGFWLPIAWLTLPVVAVAGGLIWYVFKRRYDRARLIYFEPSLWFRIGWLRQTDYYANYDDIKDMSVTAYPGGALGSIRFNIAGEQQVGDRYGKSFRPNGFDVHYVSAEGRQDHIHNHIFDEILLHRPDQEQYRELKEVYREPVIIRTSRPSLKNSFVHISLVHIALLPLLVILPLSLLVARFWLRRISYVVEDGRVLKRWGIIYRSQISIVHPKVDYIQYGQTFWEKVFKNGTIFLYTTGGRQVELRLSHLSDFRQFHAELKSYYENE